MRFFAPILLLLCLACSSKPEETILALVGNQKIRLSDYRLVREAEADLPPLSIGLKKELISDLVEEKLLLMEAKKERIKIPENELEEHLNEILAQYPPGALEKRLITLGADYDAWKERQREKMVLAKWLTGKLKDRLPFPEALQKQYYDTHRSEFAEPIRVRARQITVSSKEKGEEILKLLRQGENFVALAQQYSESPDRKEGGDLGFIEKGSYPKEFEEACFSLEVGAISPVIRSEYAYHIFKVIEKRKADRRPFSKARDLIEARLVEEEQTRLREELLARLKKEVPVVFYQEAIAGL